MTEGTLSGRARALLQRVKTKKRTGDLAALIAGLRADERLPFARALEAWVARIVDRQGEQLEGFRLQLGEWEQLEERARGVATTSAATELVELQSRLEDVRLAVANLEAEREQNAEQLATLQAWIADAMRAGDLGGARG